MQQKKQSVLDINQKLSLNEFSQIFHERAWKIANDLNKLLLSMSTGILAAFFFLLTNPIIILNQSEKYVILISVMFFTLSIMFAILSMQFDSCRNYFLGQMNKTDRDSDNSYKKQKDKVANKYYFSKNLTKITFAIGILSVGLFLVIKVLFNQ